MKYYVSWYICYTSLWSLYLPYYLINRKKYRQNTWRWSQWNNFCLDIFLGTPKKLTRIYFVVQSMYILEIKYIKWFNNFSDSIIKIFFVYKTKLMYITLKLIQICSLFILSTTLIPHLNYLVNNHTFLYVYCQYLLLHIWLWSKIK